MSHLLLHGRSRRCFGRRCKVLPPAHVMPNAVVSHDPSVGSECGWQWQQLLGDRRQRPFIVVCLRDRIGDHPQAAVCHRGLSVVTLLERTTRLLAGQFFQIIARCYLGLIRRRFALVCCDCAGHGLVREFVA